MGKQKDWGLFKEEYFAEKREVYSNKYKLMQGYWNAPFFKCHKLLHTTDEGIEIDRVISKVPGNLYTSGFNMALGDPDPFFTALGKRMKASYGQSCPRSTRGTPAGSTRPRSGTTGRPSATRTGG